MSKLLASFLVRRSHRELWLLGAAGFIAILVGFVEGVARPLMSRLESARTSLAEAIALSAWVAAKKAELEGLSGELEVSASEVGSAIGVRDIETRLDAADLRSFTTRLSGTDGGGVSLRFESVRFEQIMPWVAATEIQGGYRIVELQLSRTDLDGNLVAELLIEPNRCAGC